MLNLCQERWKYIWIFYQILNTEMAQLFKIVPCGRQGLFYPAMSISLLLCPSLPQHYSDVIMGAMVSQITSLTIFILNRSFRGRSKKSSKLCVTGLCAGNSPVTGEFPAQMASNAKNVSIWWCHYDILVSLPAGLMDNENWKEFGN